MESGKKLLRLVAILALVAMIALTLVANTYAKYTTTVSGTDTAIVAKWSVKATVDETNGTAKPFTSGTTATVNLFDESKIYDTEDGFTTAKVDANVKNVAGQTAKIAPGTWGKFSYTLTNNSDVNAAYTVAYTAEEHGVPLMWSLTGTDGSWKENLNELNTSNVPLNMTNEAKITVYWKWDFTKDTDRDTADTNLGTAATLAQPSATIQVTFDQVD